MLFRAMQLKRAFDSRARLRSLNTLLLLGLMSLFCAPALAAENNAAIQFAPYTMEAEPILGLLLPNQIWGTPGTMSTAGGRFSYVLSPPDGAIEAGALYHYAGADRAYVYDLSWRQEITTELVLAYFTIGFQYSNWVLHPVIDATTGACKPVSCSTDSGTWKGIRIGTGVMVPLSPKTPLKLGMTFYKNPQLLLLLEAGVGIRF